ncbi:MAG: carboxylesterase family protein [Bacteroidetes bacterium]|jgi:para-nitrobenzyl esterase|nr:carboxylesterase family protein [Bacteroidota bacterium]
MKYYSYLIIALILLQACQSQESIDTITSTDKGEVEGVYNSETGIYSYKGIPYAKAPVDELRWKAPQSADSWEGTLDATEFGPICMQREPVPFSMWTQEFIAPAGNMSEDCLNLNIWTKEGSVDANRPVIVFIHGGGFNSGSGSVPIYNGESMAEKDVVFVTMNYRVGILGFLAHPELTEESPNNASGNYGLMDQVAALEWVQNNISNFGGDPNNVTIAGQSAGSFSVNYLVASPLASGLFHRAIAESGAALLPSARLTMDNTLSSAEERGLEADSLLGGSGISELRELSADSVLSAQGQFGTPIIDGYVIPDQIYALFEEGNYNEVPLLTGWNEDEGFSFGPPPKAEEFRKNIQNQYGENADDVLELFPGETDSVTQQSQKNLSMLNTFGLQNWKWVQMQNQTSNAPVYLYQFTRDVPYTSEQQDFGAFHTGEVPYAYNTLHTSDRPWEQTDRQLAEMMSSYWASFAKDGDPNGEGLPEWPAAELGDYQTMFFGDSVYVDRVPMIEQLELLDRIYTERLN